MRKLRRIRAEKGLTMDALEERTGVSKRTISEIERGMRTPQTLTLAKLANALGVDLDELVEDGASKKAPAPRPDTEDAALAVLFRGLAQRGRKIVERSVKEGASEELGRELAEYHREAAALHRITPGRRDILGKNSEDLHEAQEAYQEVESRIQAMLAQDIDGVGEEVRTRRLRSKRDTEDTRTEAG